MATDFKDIRFGYHDDRHRYEPFIDLGIPVSATRFWLAEQRQVLVRFNDGETTEARVVAREKIT